LPFSLYPLLSRGKEMVEEEQSTETSRNVQAATEAALSTPARRVFAHFTWLAHIGIWVDVN